MATPAPDAQFDALASLEERIAKAVEIMSDLRQEREIIMKDLEAAIAAKEVADRETARLQQQVESLQAEQQTVKTRLQKILGQIDLLTTP